MTERLEELCALLVLALLLPLLVLFCLASWLCSRRSRRRIRLGLAYGKLALLVPVLFLAHTVEERRRRRFIREREFHSFIAHLAEARAYGEDNPVTRFCTRHLPGALFDV